jgi:peptide-methionine (R)-S-oxide reductase
MNKRHFLLAGTAAIGAVTLSRVLPRQANTQTAAAEGSKSVGGATSTGTTNSTAPFEITKTEAEWQRILTPEQFKVLRQQGTEPPLSSPLDKQFAKGTYDCAGCDLPLFTSATKFDSGTGWPSFYAPIEGAVATSVDNSLFMTRTEVHCRRCGGHLGHVFDDGPQPTGKRYCMNGVALKFVPA